MNEKPPSINPDNPQNYQQVPPQDPPIQDPTVFTSILQPPRVPLNVSPVIPDKHIKTVVFIIIGIVVLFILLAVGAVVYSMHHSKASSGGGLLLTNGIQRQARDTKRQTDVSSLQTQLEAYYSQNGHYPSLKDMNDPTWLDTNMKTLDQTALIDPLSTASDKPLVPAPTAKRYAYEVKGNDGASCEIDDTKCVRYTLTAIFEDSSTGRSTYVKQNLD